MASRRPPMGTLRLGPVRRRARRGRAADHRPRAVAAPRAGAARRAGRPRRMRPPARAAPAAQWGPALRGRAGRRSRDRRAATVGGARARCRSAGSRRRPTRPRPRGSDASCWPAPSARRPARREHHPPQRTRAVEAMRAVVARPTRGAPVVPRAGSVAWRTCDAMSIPGRPPTPASPGLRARFREALAVARQRGGARRGGPGILEGRHPAATARLEHHHAADVHVGALVELLELEERRVEGGELVRHRGRSLASPVPLPQLPRGLLFSRRRTTDMAVSAAGASRSSRGPAPARPGPAGPRGP